MASRTSADYESVGREWGYVQKVGISPHLVPTILPVHDTVRLDPAREPLAITALGRERRSIRYMHADPGNHPTLYSLT